MKFTECSKAEDFIDFFDNDEQYTRHTNYYHYTTLANVDSILNTQKLLLSNPSKKNDENEKQNDVNLFSICFSTGTSENLPLWYLYSGIDGKGARIGMKKSLFLQMTKSPKLSIVRLLDKKIELIKELQEGEYEISCRDVLYLGRDTANKNMYRAKYGGNTINRIEADIFSEFQSKAKTKNIVLKGLIWFYEKETRIQVKVNEGVLPKETDKCYVAIDISDIFDKFSVRFAPESDLNSVDIDEKPGLKKWTYTRIEKSDYENEIKMNLCDKCNKCDDCKYSKDNEESVNQKKVLVKTE